MGHYWQCMPQKGAITIIRGYRCFVLHFIYLRLFLLLAHLVQEYPKN